MLSSHRIIPISLTIGLFGWKLLLIWFRDERSSTAERHSTIWKMNAVYFVPNCRDKPHNRTTGIDVHSQKWQPYISVILNSRSIQCFSPARSIDVYLKCRFERKPQHCSKFSAENVCILQCDTFTQEIIWYIIICAWQTHKYAIYSENPLVERVNACSVFSVHCSSHMQNTSHL